MPDNTNNPDVTLAEIASLLSTLSKDLSSVISLLYVKDGDDYKSIKNLNREDWDKTTAGQLINLYLEAIPMAEEKTETIMEKAEEQSNPELYELCRIETALTFIYGCLSAITNVKKFHENAPGIGNGFPYRFPV